ncbi:MAG: hypothetical protein AAGC70_02545 [Pseudomonadota bacterium]
MTYLFGLLRIAASTLAVVAGFLSWPVWTLALAIPLHTFGSYYFSKSLYDEMTEQLDRTNAGQAARRWSGFYKAFWLRELALAFVKLGIGYALGFWIANVMGGPPSPPPA